MPLPRARVVTLNSALGPLDYRVPTEMPVEPGSVVVAPLGPRQILGIVGERAEEAGWQMSGHQRAQPLPEVVGIFSEVVVHAAILSAGRAVARR